MDVLEDSPTTETGSSFRNSKDCALYLGISVDFPTILLLCGQDNSYFFFF